MSSRKNWEEKKVSLGSAIVCAAITLAVGIGIGINWENVSSTFLPYLTFGKITSSSSIDWSDLDEVYNTLVSNFDGDIDNEAIIEGAKAGLVSSLQDKYTIYMSANEASDFQKSLHGEIGAAGVGVVVAERDGYVRIIRTLPDNPAREAGLLSGDIIYKINDEEVYALDPDQIAEKIRGENGSELSLTVVRNNKEKTFKLVREEINNVSADVTYEKDTAIILVTRFDNDTGAIIQKFAQDFEKKGIKKVILDLRDNGGGYVSAAKDLLSLWIDGDPVCIQKSKFGNTTTYAAHGKNILKDMKTIVLVNGNTASASEIVAGALQDYNKATILGTTTYGKGVVQSLIDLSSNTMLKVTSAHWYTPKDKSINGTGIKPDKEVTVTYDEINAGKDPQLDAAKEL